VGMVAEAPLAAAHPQGQAQRAPRDLHRSRRLLRAALEVALRRLGLHG